MDRRTALAQLYDDSEPLCGEVKLARAIHSKGEAFTATGGLALKAATLLSRNGLAHAARRRDGEAGVTITDFFIGG